ncbi:Putative ribonuclease H protein At1g65750, partial [Linum perenne]
LLQKLAGWKVKSLSTEGRVSLANSVLNSIPTYAMQTSLLPVETCNQIDKKIRDFIWGSFNGEWRIHPVNWEMVCSPRDQGGLGLRSARELNYAFLMKLMRGILKKPKELWVEVLTTKYLKQSNEGLIPRKSKIWSSCWRGLNETWPTFISGLSWGIHNGRKVNFWKEKWVDSRKIIAEIVTPPPELENWTVADFCSEEGQWSVGRLSGILPHSLLREVLGMTPPNCDLGENIPIWGIEPKGGYTVKSGYLLAKDLALTETDNRWKLIWRWKGPQRVQHFLWLMGKGRLLTNEERCRRHLATNNECGICPGLSESCLHITRDCLLAKQVWCRSLNILETDNFFRSNFDDWWSGNLLDKRKASRFWVTCWVLWRNINERIFGGRTLNTTGVIKQCDYWTQIAEKAYENCNS